ncbi:SDR family NAD(P)-dependent oxidoreductase [Streptomyces sp. NPDC005262]|uniref:SDR family NAD(P)-dependent oxidoreductase n=1 Tax=Streptomyces sp. NPDC005262 TaxID=3364710 RepID=UPI0036818316
MEGAFRPPPRGAAYGASKAYVLHFSLALQREVAPTGIRVQVVLPGPVAHRVLRSRGDLVHVPRRVVRRCGRSGAGRARRAGPGGARLHSDASRYGVVGGSGHASVRSAGCRRGARRHRRSLRAAE